MRAYNPQKGVAMKTPRIASALPTAESAVLAACKHLLSVHRGVAWWMRCSVGRGYVIRPRFGAGKKPYQQLKCQLDACVAAGLLQRTQITWLEWGDEGSSDLLGMLRGGRLLAVECKKPGGKLTSQQAAFASLINDSGGLAVCVNDVSCLDDALRKVLCLT